MIVAEMVMIGVIVAGCVAIAGMEAWVGYLAIRAGYLDRAIIHGLTAVLALIVLVAVLSS